MKWCRENFIITPPPQIKKCPMKLGGHKRKIYLGRCTALVFGSPQSSVQEKHLDVFSFKQ